jgi:hypothetical protein
MLWLDSSLRYPSHGSAYVKKTVSFFVKAGVAESEPLSPEPKVEGLPPEFAVAKKLWKVDQIQAARAIKKYLKCSFEPSNIYSDLSQLLVDPKQIDTSKVDLLWVDYSSDTLPVVSAEAYFEMDFVDGVTAGVVQAWEEQNDELINGFTFYWDLHKEAVGEYFFLWSNSGSSMDIKF